LRILRKEKKKKIYVDSHILDYAINDSLKRYESCLTNLKNRHIKHFRLRYLKCNKENKIIKIEKLAFDKNGGGFYVNTLGKLMKCEINDFDYRQNIKTVATLKYSREKDSFHLHIKYNKPDVSNKPDHKDKYETIALDPGIRKMLTGYTNNGILMIGTNAYKKIKKKLKVIDNIMNRTDFSESKKRRLQKKKYTKIKNMIEDLQWKTVKYLMKRYKSIVMGNFSTKSMGESKKIPKMVKRIGNLYSFFQLKNKLKYACHYTGTVYSEIDEAFT